MVSRLILSLLLLAASADLYAAGARVAVASNFASVAHSLAGRFSQMTGDRIEIVPGSTGKLYAQIVHGAPFDAFLAADERRPRLLARSGHTVAGTRFTYAVGQLALWYPRAKGSDGPREALAHLRKGRLAIANPQLAPYGLAARQTLQRMHLWQRLQSRLALGENISQTYQYVDSGNAVLGFIALSHARHNHLPREQLWIVPARFHKPIEQQAVQLTLNKSAAAFLRFLRGPRARPIIEAAGYRTAD